MSKGFSSGIDFGQFAVLTRSLRRKGWFPFAVAALAILLMIQVIRLFWLVITPVGPVGDWRASEVQLLSPQSRLALFNSFDPFFRGEPAQSGSVVTSLQLTLYGIRMNEGSGLGSAILAGPDGVQGSYAVGDEIAPGAKLASVQFDHVTIDRGGNMESLYMDQSVPAETVGGESGIAQPVTSTLLDGAPEQAPIAALTGGLASGLSGAVTMQPRSFEGKVTGIVVSPQGSGAMFKAAGFRDGDIITSVNGKPVTSTADIESLKSQIAPGARISVNVERGANTVPISINLPGQ